MSPESKSDRSPGSRHFRHIYKLFDSLFKRIWGLLWPRIPIRLRHFRLGRGRPRLDSHILSDPELPFRTALKRRFHPNEMRLPPALRNPEGLPRVEEKYALLLNPFYSKDQNSSFGKHVLTPSLALTSLAGATPSDWRLEYWDENLLQGPPPVEPLPKVVGITVHLTFAARAYRLADFYRRLGSKVILGGLHVISCPEEAACHADAIAIGDGVQLWPEILQDIQSGTLRPIYRANFTRDYGLDPIPDRSILPQNSFLTTGSINATRGCHNRCQFCYMSTRGLNMPYRNRPIEQVIREIKNLPEDYFVFTDNNLGADQNYLMQLCQALRPLNTIWSAAISMDVTDQPQLVREMALAGCTGVFVGFESLSDNNLQEARKKTPAVKEYSRRLAIFRDVGIHVNGSFVFGFDDDRRDVFAKTVDWIENNRLECATFHILTPYPGTDLFRQLDSQGRLLHKNWDLYDTAHAVFLPKHMKPEELEHGYAWTYQRLFSFASIWHRRPNNLSTLPQYLAMAYLYKKSNWLWRILIRHDLTKAVWKPMVKLTKRRHLAFRKKLSPGFHSVVSAGV